MCKENDLSDWDQHVAKIQWGYNNTYQQAIRTTPFRLLFNYEPRHVSGDCIQKELQEDQNCGENIEQVRLEAIKTIREDQAKQRERYNARRAQATKYEVGDLVLIKREPPASGESRKLAEKYRGPYIVTEVLPNDRYRVEDLPETQRTQKFYKGVAAVDSMRRYYTLSGIGSEEEEGSEEEQGEEAQMGNENQDIRRCQDQVMKQETEEQTNTDPDRRVGLNTKEKDDEERRRQSRKKRRPKHLDDYITFEDESN
ncbi:unnamed protein product [Callosobruchus maculatus]|uniref:Integrase catalytic domain-containing protein n=1 Tax=Callosobruchus maculatus TaxID=64391 RepID=A0A653DHR7_CALMS|nr:unnamed protein product [Callosobruchus maculatus]